MVASEIYTLSLHELFRSGDCMGGAATGGGGPTSAGSTPSALLSNPIVAMTGSGNGWYAAAERSEEHTSELQSHSDLVCRLLLEKTKHNRRTPPPMPPNKN